LSVLLHGVNDFSLKLLLQSFEEKNESEFQYAIEVLKAKPTEPIGDFSMFEKILLTPKSEKFIELCIFNGCSFYEVRKTLINLCN